MSYFKCSKNNKALLVPSLRQRSEVSSKVLYVTHNTAFNNTVCVYATQLPVVNDFNNSEHILHK